MRELLVARGVISGPGAPDEGVRAARTAGVPAARAAHAEGVQLPEGKRDRLAMSMMNGPTWAGYLSTIAFLYA